MPPWGSLDILGGCGLPDPGSNPGGGIYSFFNLCDNNSLNFVKSES